MTIQEVHERINFELNKPIGGYIPTEKVDMVLDRAQMAELNYLLGNDREYQPGRAISRVGYGVNRKIHQDLMHLKQTIEFNADNYASTNQRGTGPSGIIVLPSNFLYLTGLSDSSRRPIEVVSEDKIMDIVNSELIAPSSTERYAVLGGKGGTYNSVTFTTYKIQTFPEEAFAGYINYIKRPATPVYAYTLSGRTLTYDSANSQDLEWPDNVVERIINRALAMLGEHLKESNVSQYNEAKNQTGV